MKNRTQIVILAILSSTFVSPNRASNWLSYLKKSPIYTTITKRPLLTLATIGLSCAAGYLCKRYKATIMRTRIGFHISRYYNKIRYGSDFNFNQMAGDPIDQDSKLTHRNDEINITRDQTGKILAIHDGKNTPLMLGSIPATQNHIHHLNPQDHRVGIFTLNEPWECNATGLSHLTKNNAQITQFHYPTADFSAPSFIDLIRAVRDLENRDTNNLQVSLVHCKAGRGRSATVIACYIAHVIHKAHIETTPEKIEAYIVARRPQVRLDHGQKEALSFFYSKLKEAGNFNNLYRLHRDTIERRDQEITTNTASLKSLKTV